MESQLTKSQLACMAARDWHLYDGRSGGNRRYMENKKDVPLGDTRTLLSRKFHVAGRYIQLAKKILESDLDLFEKIERGEQPLPWKQIVPYKNKEKSYALYKAYDNEGNLLYVGITCEVGERMKAHAAGSQWWDEFETLKVNRNFTNRAELESAESFVIKNDNPKYNVR